MLDEKDLQAIAQLMERQKAEILKESAANMRVILESYVEPKFNLLAESIDALRDKLDTETMEAMQEELDLHHAMLKRHTREIAELKKAQ